MPVESQMSFRSSRARTKGKNTSLVNIRLAFSLPLSMIYRQRITPGSENTYRIDFLFVMARSTSGGHTLGAALVGGYLKHFSLRIEKQLGVKQWRQSPWCFAPSHLGCTTPLHMFPPVTIIDRIIQINEQKGFSLSR